MGILDYTFTQTPCGNIVRKFTKKCTSDDL